jgi:hypothetical protein
VLIRRLDQTKASALAISTGSLHNQAAPKIPVNERGFIANYGPQSAGASVRRLPAAAIAAAGARFMIEQDCPAPCFLYLRPYRHVVV